jgi:hypothetical protein
MRDLPKTAVLVEMMQCLINQIQETAPTFKVSDPIDRAVREEILRVFGELHLSRHRLSELLALARVTPLRTDTGTLVDVDNN